MSGIRLVCRDMEPQSVSVLRSAVGRRLRERGCAPEGLPLYIGTDAALQEDEYRIRGGADAAEITAGGVIGAFSGVGEYLRLCSFDGRGGFAPFVGEYTLKPDNPIHGMYFASHFQNFYEAAPVEEVLQVIEDLALGGCNALAVWYDMHQYTDVDSPASVEMIARLKAFFCHAALTGMKTVFLTLANESFSTSDPAIRAEWWVQNGYYRAPGGHYHVEICPNKPGGLEEILRQRRRVMEAFSDAPIDYLSIWPYDQGGCTCAKCTPWGSNGFLKTLDALHGLYAEILPEAKILCSTWYFDRFVREWDSFNDAFNTGKYDYVSYLFGYFANDEPVPPYIREGKMPGGKRMVAFPEISMYSCSPWGGFGANPMPARMEENFRSNGSLYCGALPYSEGIFEDINKAMMLAFYSGRLDSAEDVLREYARSEFCLDGEAVDDFVRMVCAMERTLRRKPTDENGEPVSWRENGYPYEKLRYEIAEPGEAAEIERLSAKLEAALPAAIRDGWRWQILRLRAVIDAELAANDMHFSDRFEACMEKLTTLFYAQNAYYTVTPITRAAICGPKRGQAR